MTIRGAGFCGRSVLVAILAVCASTACAQWFVPWKHAPAITVVVNGDDPRTELVREAAGFWNRMLEESGSAFRLGAVTVVDRAIPERDLQEFGAWFVGPQGPKRPAPPASLVAPPGDLLVYLAHSDFVSYASWFTQDGRRIVGIRGVPRSPLSLPNVARNVIAHEIGHAIGLGHNADPTLLMCGRPAPCRPDEFRSSEPRYFPLNDEEKRRLLEMYPANWTPR